MVNAVLQLGNTKPTQTKCDRAEECLDHNDSKSLREGESGGK